MQKTLCTNAFCATSGSVKAGVVQEANWAFFEITRAFFVARIARSKLGFKNKFPEPLNVDIFMMVQPLRPRIFLIHHLSPPSQFITHAILYGQPLHSRKGGEPSSLFYVRPPNSQSKINHKHKRQRHQQEQHHKEFYIPPRFLLISVFSRKKTQRRGTYPHIEIA